MNGGQDFDKVLALLESEPEPTEFTHVTKVILEEEKCETPIRKRLMQACDIIDRLTAANRLVLQELKPEREQSKPEPPSLPKCPKCGIYYCESNMDMCWRCDSFTKDHIIISKNKEIDRLTAANRLAQQENEHLELRIKELKGIIEKIKNGVLKLNDDLDTTEYSSSNAAQEHDRQQWRGELIMNERVLKLINKELEGQQP